jgi:hypothetical protein
MIDEAPNIAGIEAALAATGRQWHASVKNRGWLFVQSA